MQEPVTCEAASRTDRGVHAKGQVVQFWASKDISARALNGVLPKDIRVLELEYRDFHPTLDALRKTYYYDICLGPVQEPFHRELSWHYPYQVDLEKMREAADSLVGTRDFSAYTTEIPKNPICNLQIHLEQSQSRLRIALTGDRFLYKMARIVAGTLANIGSGKIFLGEVGVTAPAHGLTLYKVYYNFAN